LLGGRIGGFAAYINGRGTLIRPIGQWSAEAVECVGNTRPAWRLVLHPPEQFLQFVTSLLGLNPGLLRLPQFICHRLGIDHFPLPAAWLARIYLSRFVLQMFFLP
jgi:hypothetical protein